MKKLLKSSLGGSPEIGTLILATLLYAFVGCSHKDVSPSNIIYQNTLAIDDNTWTKACTSGQWVMCSKV